MKKNTITKEQAWGNLGFVASSAVRYALGRMTYIVQDTSDWLCLVWDELPDGAKAIIRRDVEDAFQAKESGAINRPGMVCDVKEWQRVRNLWVKEGSTE